MLLSDQIILLRAKRASLQSVKELNLCGYNLTDVSAVSKLAAIEVLALSVNNITSLVPFRECKKLRELYLRRNNIADIKQVFHLRGLPHLRNLWLNENPICQKLGSNYRAKILSILPNLKILDNVPVTREDIEQSKYLGDDYEEDVDREQITEEKELPSIEYIRNDNSPISQESSNVLTAIFSLVKELDMNGLEILHNNIGDRISNICGKRH